MSLLTVKFQESTTVYIPNIGEVVLFFDNKWKYKDSDGNVFLLSGDGNGLTSSTQVPNNNIGENGFHHLNTSTGKLYKKELGVWNEVFSFNSGSRKGKKYPKHSSVVQGDIGKLMMVEVANDFSCSAIVCNPSPETIGQKGQYKFTFPLNPPIEPKTKIIKISILEKIGYDYFDFYRGDFGTLRINFTSQINNAQSDIDILNNRGNLLDNFINLINGYGLGTISDVNRGYIDNLNKVGKDFIGSGLNDLELSYSECNGRIKIVSDNYEFITFLGSSSELFDWENCETITGQTNGAVLVILREYTAPNAYYCYRLDNNPIDFDEYFIGNNSNIIKQFQSTVITNEEIIEITDFLNLSISYHSFQPFSVIPYYPKFIFNTNTGHTINEYWDIKTDYGAVSYNCEVTAGNFIVGESVTFQSGITAIIVSNTSNKVILRNINGTINYGTNLDDFTGDVSGKTSKITGFDKMIMGDCDFTLNFDLGVNSNIFTESFLITGNSNNYFGIQILQDIIPDAVNNFDKAELIITQSQNNSSYIILVGNWDSNNGGGLGVIYWYDLFNKFSQTIGTDGSSSRYTPYKWFANTSEWLNALTNAFNVNTNLLTLFDVVAYPQINVTNNGIEIILRNKTIPLQGQLNSQYFQLNSYFLNVSQITLVQAIESILKSVRKLVLGVLLEIVNNDVYIDDTFIMELILSEEIQIINGGVSGVGIPQITGTTLSNILIAWDDGTVIDYGTYNQKYGNNNNGQVINDFILTAYLNNGIFHGMANTFVPDGSSNIKILGYKGNIFLGN